jgi:hypothetical protein
MKPSRSAMDMVYAVKLADGSHLETQRHRRRGHRARRPLPAGRGGDRRRHPPSTSRPAISTRANRWSTPRRARRWRRRRTASCRNTWSASTSGAARRPTCHVSALRLRRRLLGVEAERALDQGILRALWLTPEELAASVPAPPQPAGDAMRARLPGRPALAARFDAPTRASHEQGHVVVGMSGGVDSSVAAMLLKRAGLRRWSACS